MIGFLACLLAPKISKPCVFFYANRLAQSFRDFALAAESAGMTPEILAKLLEDES